MSKPFVNREMKNLLLEWQGAKEDLDVVKQREAELRIDICDFLLHQETPGAHKYDVDGIRIKATRKLSYSLDQSKIDELWQTGQLHDYEEEVIKVGYTLKLGVYQKSTDDMDRLNSLITTKDGMPSLEIID